MFVALVDSGRGAVNILEPEDGEAVVGKPDEWAVLSHDLIVVACGRPPWPGPGPVVPRGHRTREGFECVDVARSTSPVPFI